MSITLTELNDGKLIEIEVTGKLTKESYVQFVPVIESAIQQHGKVSMLVVMHDFHGWSAGALWEDLKFDLKHFSHIERVGIVGESTWEHGMAIFCKPFTSATIKYFDHADLEKARDWIRG